MFSVYFVAFLALKGATGAKIPAAANGGGAPVFQDECKDPTLNDCPPTSTCIDQFYGYACQCKPGLIDESPNIQENPGRICVKAGSDGAGPLGSQEGETTTPGFATKKKHTATGTTEQTNDLDATKSPLDQVARDSAGTDRPRHHKRKGHAKNATKEDAKEKESEPANEVTDSATRDAFDYFDTTKDGHINLAELKAATRNLGQKLSNDDLKKMLAAADRNGDSVVNFEEFNRFMKASRRRTSSS